MAAPAVGQQQSWWQCLLIYPTLAVAVLTAAPTWIDKLSAFAANVPSYREAREQDEYWRTRHACIAAPFEWSRDTDVGRLEAKVCAPGDVMLTRVMPREGEETYRWVRLIGPEETGGFSLIPAAHAQTTTPPAPSGGSAKGTSNTQQVQVANSAQREVAVTRQEGSECLTERIDTYTGKVISRQIAPCTPANQPGKPN